MTNIFEIIGKITGRIEPFHPEFLMERRYRIYILKKAFKDAWKKVNQDSNFIEICKMINEEVLKN